jgi:two-component system response regulator GlrR
MNSAIKPHTGATILAIDDDPSILRVMGLRLKSHGHIVLAAADGRQALDVARQTPIDLAVIDYKLNGENGVSLMEALREVKPELPVIILTAYGTINNAVDAMQRGACNYMTKPFDGVDLIAQIDSCLKAHHMQPSDTAAEPETKGVFDRIVAESSAMKAVLAQVAQVAATDTNVYIEGESGTGKELIAQCLHKASGRKNGPFIAINCAAIPENLMESELFGYAKGAFTGAERSRDGLFTQAHGGSFFFDELAELSLPMQAKLLRALESREYYPLGSNRKVSVDVRVIAASNRDLEKDMEEGRFREDLYYRIRVIPVSLPPLRERKEDIPLLARHFIKEFSKASGKTVLELSPSAAKKLMAADWPGNVRELKNAMEYAVAMATGRVVTPDLISGPPVGGKERVPSYRDARDSFEKDYLVQLLASNNGNVSKAAKAAGKYRADLYVLLRKHGLDPTAFRRK